MTELSVHLYGPIKNHMRDFTGKKEVTYIAGMNRLAYRSILRARISLFSLRFWKLKTREVKCLFLASRKVADPGRLPVTCSFQAAWPPSCLTGIQDGSASHLGSISSPQARPVSGSAEPVQA